MGAGCGTDEDISLLQLEGGGAWLAGGIMAWIYVGREVGGLHTASRMPATSA